jgi:hypothetical protein
MPFANSLLVLVFHFEEKLWAPIFMASNNNRISHGLQYPLIVFGPEFALSISVLVHHPAQVILLSTSPTLA